MIATVGETLDLFGYKNGGISGATQKKALQNWVTGVISPYL